MYRGYNSVYRRCFNRYPSSTQILSLAFFRAMPWPISSSKFSGEAHADSPVTVKPFCRVTQQTVSWLSSNRWYCVPFTAASMSLDVSLGAFRFLRFMAASTSESFSVFVTVILC
jgi:hypothetical protein